MAAADYDIIIVGAGISGLSCARYLNEAGVDFIILEAGSSIGGRIQTDAVDGYLMDHGFQVFQTAYPEAIKQLDYKALNLSSFAPGAMVRFNGAFHILADPLRLPRHIFASFKAPIGSLMDRLRVLALVCGVSRGEINAFFTGPETTTFDYLKSYGFTDDFIKGLFAPFFGGVFLDSKLNASSQVFRYLFRIFSKGEATLPGMGMGAIPLQLASTLPDGVIRTNHPVERINGQTVHLASGEKLSAGIVVLATSSYDAHRLLRLAPAQPSYGEYCLYYAMDTPPIREPFLLLNGEGKGVINNIAFPSLVSETYAPAGKTLMSVVVLTDAIHDAATLRNDVEVELLEWFGAKAKAWQYLRTYHIEHALPDQRPPITSPFGMHSRSASGLYICGEYGSLPGIQWALMSGRRVARDIISGNA